jgi:hypothetical protein
MKPQHNMTSPIQRQAERYTQEQLRLLLSVRDMVKNEVRKEVARQLNVQK